MKSVLILAGVLMSQVLFAQSRNVVAVESKKSSLISQRCVRAMEDYLDEKAMLKSDRESLLKGFGAAWDESLYMDGQSMISLLFSSAKVIYFYNEGSDVSGEVYRCDRETGEISQPLKNYSHYPSCDGINEAIAAEAATGAPYYDYCAEHPQD